MSECEQLDAARLKRLHQIEAENERLRAENERMADAIESCMCDPSVVDLPEDVCAKFQAVRQRGTDVYRVYKITDPPKFAELEADAARWDYVRRHPQWYLRGLGHDETTIDAAIDALMTEEPG